MKNEQYSCRILDSLYVSITISMYKLILHMHVTHKQTILSYRFMQWFSDDLVYPVSHFIWHHIGIGPAVGAPVELWWVVQASGLVALHPQKTPCALQSKEISD